MNKEKSRSLILFGLLILFLISLSFYNTKTAQQGDLFVKRVLREIRKEGSVLSVSDLYSGDWTHVCILNSESTGAYVDQDLLKGWFKIPSEIKLDLPYGIVSASEWNWGIVFFTPPNKIELLYIANEAIFGNMNGKYAQDYGMCLRREAAFVSMSEYFYHGKKSRSLNFARKDFFKEGSSSFLEVEKKIKQNLGK